LILYYITDRKQFPGNEAEQCSAMLDRVSCAARAGVDFIQLREKDLSSRALEPLARRAMEMVKAARKTHGSRTRLLINSRTDVAIACGADSVHLQSSAAGEISAADAGAIFDAAGVAQPIIAVSCHTEREVLLAESEGADFVVYGPIFEKDGTVASGLSELARIARRQPASMPVLALGGITQANAAETIAAGAAGVAGIRLFQQGDMADVVERLRSLQNGSPQRRRDTEGKF